MLEWHLRNMAEVSSWGEQMKPIMTLVLAPVAIVSAGCAMLSYDGMPTEDEPHAVVVEGSDLNLVSVDGRRVEGTPLTMFKSPWLRLTPGQHQIVTSLQYERQYPDDDDDDEWVFKSVRCESPHRHTITLTAEEGVSYIIRSKINAPSRRLRPHRCTGGIRYVMLRDPDEWHPFVARTEPIKRYWKGRPSSSAEAEHETPSAGQESEPANQ